MRTWAVVFTNVRGPSLILDGATAQGDAFWTETVSISPGTNYELGFWSVWCNSNNGANTASLQVYLNGVAVGKPVDLSPDYDGCTQGRMKFNSGSATQVTISLVDLHTGDSWNDLAADDIPLKAIE